MSDNSVKKFVTVGAPETPFEVDGTPHVVRRASAKAARLYREASLVGAEMEFQGDDDAADKKRVLRKMQGLAGVEPLLVSLCTFVKDGDKYVPVSKEVVEGWDGEIVKWAFAEVKRLSPWLDEKDGEALEALKRRRDRLNEQIARLEANDPKG